MIAGGDRRKWVRRTVDLSVRLLFPTTGLRNVLEANVRLKDISEGGSLMDIGALTNVPDFFYIQFGNDKSEMIGCYVAGRATGVIRAQFCNEMTSARIDEIIAQSRSAALIDELFGNDEHGGSASETEAMRALFSGG